MFDKYCLSENRPYNINPALAMVVMSFRQSVYNSKQYWMAVEAATKGGSFEMPVYEYECEKCGHRFELIHSVNDEGRKKCPECKGKAKKCFLPVGIVFKGSGFYKTDSRKKTSDFKPSCESCESSSSSDSSAACGATSTCESKPECESKRKSKAKAG